MNEYIRGKMDAQAIILDDITRKQVIWNGHVKRMDPMRIPKIMIHWKPEGRKKTRPSLENLERWNIYSDERKRSKNGQMEQSKAMEYESRKASSDVLKPRNLYIYIYILLILNLSISVNQP
jgi:hypothetical protein